VLRILPGLGRGIGRRDGATAAMLLLRNVGRCHGYGGAGQELHWHARRCYWGMR